MDIRPIRTDADYRQTLDDIEGLMRAEADSAEGDRLDVLTTLVEAYEAERFPVADPDPIAAILFMMGQKQFGERDLAAVVGSPSRVRDILERRKALTLPMIRALSRVLDIPADVLIQPYAVGDRADAA